MANNVEPKVAVEAPETPAQVNAVEINANGLSTFDEKVVKLLADKNNKVYRNLKVRNVIVELADEDRPRVTLVVSSLVDGYVRDEEGVYKLDKTHNVFVSIFAISGILKEDEDTAMLANYVIRNPRVCETLLSGALITVVQMPIKANEEYVNPFSTRTDSEPYVRDHDWMASHVIKLQLGAMGNKVVDKILDKIVDSLV